MSNTWLTRFISSHTAIESTRKLGVAGIIAASESGQTARDIAAFRGPTPVLAICYNNEKTMRWLNLSYGVIPIYQKKHLSSLFLFVAALRMLLQKGYIKKDDNNGMSKSSLFIRSCSACSAMAAMVCTASRGYLPDAVSPLSISASVRE